MRKAILSLTVLIFLPLLLISNDLDTLNARIYLNEAVVFQKKFKPKKALPLLKKALTIYLEELGETSEEVSDVYYNLGDCYLDLAKFETALNYLQKSLSIRLLLLDSSAVKIGDNYTLIGLYYDYQTKYDIALEFYDKALKIYKSALPHDDPRIGVVYNSMGICFYSKGDVAKSILFFEKTYSMTVSYKGQNNVRASRELNNIGICNSKMKKNQVASECFNKAINIALGKKSIQTMPGARLFHSSGINYFELKQFGKALKYLNDALDIRLKEIGTNHPEVATNYYAIGLCYLEMGKLKLAKDYFQKALKINIKIFGKYHPETGMCYERLAKVALSNNLLDQALLNIDYALLAFKFEEAGLLESDVLPNKQLMEVLDTKAKIHKVLFENTNDISQLIISNRIYKLLIKLINKFRIDYKEGRSKEILANNFYHIYDDAIEVSYLFYEKTKDESFLYEAFGRSKQSSSLVLLEALRNSKAKVFAGIPDSLLKKEEDLKLEITFYEKQKHLEEEKDENERNDLEVTKTNSLIFDLKQKYYKLIQLFETQYPQYFRLKYDLKTVSVAQVQENLLDSDQAMVEYFLGENSVFVFIITKTDFKVVKIVKDFPLEEYAETLREKIVRFQFPFNLPDNYHSELVNSSHQLYNRLIKPIQGYLPKRIIVIPGAELSHIPFEVFIKKINGKDYQYKNHEYLLNAHSIGYCYSATLLYEMVEKRTSEAEENLLAIAPIFGNDIKPVTLRSMNLASLKYNVPEAKKVAKMLGGETLIGANATEKKFVEKASKYHMIHLATHGKADNRIGEYCHLGFTEIIDTIENEWLFVKDIYNVKLNSAMVTLSACETGVGEIRKGEGVISLARSFSYAGAGCINTTLWKVSDKKTGNLMEFFYENIKSGESKDEAMRLAKLNFIKAYDNLEVHPFYWSSFITIGDMITIAPEYIPSSKWWIWIFIGMGLTLFLSYFFFFRNVF